MDQGTSRGIALMAPHSERKRWPITPAALAKIAQLQDCELLPILTDPDRKPEEKNLALETILGRYWTNIVFAAQRVLGNEHDAEDVAQEVISLLLVGLAANFDPAKGNLGTFLQTVARNRARDLGRRKTRQANLRQRLAHHPNGDTTPDALAALVQQEDEDLLRNYVRRHLAQLPGEDLPELLTAQHFDELSCQQIAESFGLPVS